MMRLLLVFIGLFSVLAPFSVVAQTTDPFVLQMQIQAVQTNINALKAENEALKVELEQLNATLKKKKTGAAIAIGAGVVGTGVGAYGVYKGIKAKQDLKATQAELDALKAEE